MSFEVSVIIPVYNAKLFLQKSIQSALDQEEVKEVLVIDDGSTDGSYELLQSWNELEERIQLYTHANRENKGPGPSRNVGIKNATCEYVSFLDADDYYLEGRFKNTKSTFYHRKEVEAVYEPVLFYALSDKYRDYYNGHIPVINGNYYICFNEDISELRPIERWWLDGGFYYICGLTIKRKVLMTIGLFDPRLYQAEDTDLHYRIALHTNVLYISDIDTTKSVRTVHGANMTLEDRKKSESMKILYSKYLFLLKNVDVNSQMKKKLLIKYLISRAYEISQYKIIRYVNYLYYAIHLVIRKPEYFRFLVSVRKK